MATTPEIEWEESYLEPVHAPELKRELERSIGFVAPFFPYYFDCPWIPRSFVEVGYLNGSRLVHVGMELYEKLNLVVSQQNSCRFCIAAYRSLLRLAGIPEERIRRLEQDLLAADLEPAERAALEFARKLARASPLPTPADLERLRDAGPGEAWSREVAFVAAWMGTMNQLATFSAVSPESMERWPWYAHLLRPFIARRFSSRWRQGKPETLEPELRSGPFAYLVDAFDGLPTARSLRNVVDAAWSSPLLPRRTKALVFAVVARGLGAARAGREAARLSAEEGVDADALDEVLDHLESPALDAVESEAVPFARETLWYQPAPIQRRVRELRGKLEAPQVSELIGISALANTLCRLDVVIPEAK